MKVAKVIPSFSLPDSLIDTFASDSTKNWDLFKKVVHSACDNFCGSFL